MMRSRPLHTGPDGVSTPTNNNGNTGSTAYRHTNSHNNNRRGKHHTSNHSGPSSVLVPTVCGVFLTILLMHVFWSFGNVPILLEAEERAAAGLREKAAATTGDAAAVTSLRQNQANAGPVGQQQGCRYDGHCPVRTTCAVAPTDKAGTLELPGVCERFISAQEFQNENAAKLEKCASACFAELQADEHFFHELFAVETGHRERIVTPGRPDGCLLHYKRVSEDDAHQFSFGNDPDADQSMKRKDHLTGWRDLPRAIQKWVDERFRFVIRVDPLNDDPNDDTWVAYCYQPCDSDEDCAVTRQVTGTPKQQQAFFCDKGSCQRNAAFWKKDMDEAKQREMIIVTGATANYAPGLINFVASAEYWAPNNKVVIYNLGDLPTGVIRDLESRPNVLSVEWKNGVPESLPAHIREGKKYAWKPLIINETVHKYHSIFWLDAGSTLAGPVTPTENILERNGIFLVKGQDGDMKMSHPGSYLWFNTTKETLKTGPHFSGNTQGFLYPSRFIDSVVKPNAACALDPNCISPSGSSLNNHRYDQTTLSIISYNPKVRVPHHTEYLAAGRNQLANNMLEPSYKFVWTARQSCGFYTQHRNQKNV